MLCTASKLIQLTLIIFPIIDPNSSQYSPSRLASLFESNLNAVDEDIARSKHAVQNITPTSLFETSNETHDLDELGNFTLETESGIKVLDTTLEINRKAIFSDFDRLKRWQHQTMNKSLDNMDDMFISESSDHSFQQQRVDDSKNNIDSDIENMLETLPNLSDSVLGFPNEIISPDEEINISTYSTSPRENTKLENFTINSQFDFPIADSDINIPFCNTDNGTLLSLSDGTSQNEDMAISNTASDNNILDIGSNLIECDTEALLDDLLVLPEVPSDDPRLIINNTNTETDDTDLLSLLPSSTSNEILAKNDSSSANNDAILYGDTNSDSINVNDIMDRDDTIDNDHVDELVSEFIPAKVGADNVIVDNTNVSNNILVDELANRDTDKVEKTENLVPELINSHDENDKALDDLLNSNGTDEVDDLVDIANNITTNTPVVDNSENVADDSNLISIIQLPDENLSNSQADSDDHNIEVSNCEETLNDDTEVVFTITSETNRNSVLPVDNTADGLELPIDAITSPNEFSVCSDCDVKNNQEKVIEESDTYTPVVDLNVDISSVQQKSENSIECLTPDNDGISTMDLNTENDNESDFSDIEKYMTTTMETVESSSEIDSQLCNVDVEIPSENNVSESLVLDIVPTDVTSVDGNDGVDLLPESTPEFSTSSEIPVCFSTDDVSVQDDELDELVSTLVIDDQSNETVSQPSENTIIEQSSNVLVEMPEIQPADSVIECALAATVAPDLQANESIDVAESDASVSNNDVVINESDEASANETTSSPVSQLQASSLNTDENIGGINHQMNSQAVRRTSLRNNTSVSNPDRHVRFSLTPQYEGAPPINGGNTLPTPAAGTSSQQPEGSTDESPAGIQVYLVCLWQLHSTLISLNFVYIIEALK